MLEQKTENQAREEILSLVSEYYEKFHKNTAEYKEGNRIPYAARVYDENEMRALVDSSLDFWLTMGRYSERFEKEFAQFLGVRFCSVTNSGSSANLLAFMALTSAELGEKRIKPGDEVITVAAGFPTTVSPIVGFGAVPVFVDVTLPQYNIDVSKLDAALSDKTKAVMAAHTLGNPFDVKAVRDFCDKNGLWLVEDNCDALGSKVFLDGEWKYSGTVGHIGTSSFYPPHHMTMGEGGAVYTNDPLLHRLVNSFRDWGRDCRCPSGVDNCCHHRFDGHYGELPENYDHKYVYSHFGFNLKITDMQAAVGCEQLKKLPSFIEKRRQNWKRLRDGLAPLSDRLILPEPLPQSQPSWFGFLITVKEDSGLSRADIVRSLENSGIQTRMLFAGNLIKHPCFNEMRATKTGYRVAGSLDNTDSIMSRTFWVGVYPGMDNRRLDYMVQKITEACEADASH